MTLAYMLVSVGIGLMAQSWVALAYVVVVAAVVVAYRIAVEEEALISELGERYVSYSRRVKRIIPFVL